MGDDHSSGSNGPNCCFELWTAHRSEALDCLATPVFEKDIASTVMKVTAHGRKPDGTLTSCEKRVGQIDHFQRCFNLTANCSEGASFSEVP